LRRRVGAAGVGSHPIEDESGDRRIDLTKLRRFALANDCWNPEYMKLNPGMQRMNVVNRLRAKVRRDAYEVKWA